MSITSTVRPRGWFWAEDNVFDLPISAVAKLTVLYLKRRADADGTSFPSIATIALAVSSSPRSVHRAIAELVEAKALMILSGRRNGDVNDYSVLPLGSATQAGGSATVAEGVRHTGRGGLPQWQTEGIHKEGIPKKELKPPTLSGKPDDAQDILNFLNHKADRNYQATTNLDFIRARLKAGATIYQCKAIISRKVRAWKGTDMDSYLRPATLFNATKFAQYLGELPATMFSPEEEESNA